MIDRLRRLGTLALSYVPSRAPQTIARRLVLRANAARDARQWEVASVLYEEALRFTPTSRIHKQCGHMFKEAGHFDMAEHHYRQAERLNPTDADLALQVGHFEKMRGDLSGAAAAYRHALTIKPGWDEPLEELSRLPAATNEAKASDGLPVVIAELLPRDAAPHNVYRETIQIRRLGSIRQRTNGYGRILRGVEAIRGFCISATALTEIVVLLDELEIARRPLSSVPLRGGYLKYVFNLWIDFSTRPYGNATIGLRLVDVRGRSRGHRVAAEIVAPVKEQDFPDSDAIVDLPVRSDLLLADEINARSSMVRSSQRAPVAGAVKTIFVQRIDQLGDLIVSVPALLRLRQLFPQARITLLVTPANAGFAQTLEAVDEILTIEITADADGRRAIPQEAQSVLRQALASRYFDIAIDLGQGAESRPLLRLIPARFTYGFRSATAQWLSASFDLGAPDPINGLEICAPSRKLVAMIDALGRMQASLPAPLPPQLDPAILRLYGLREKYYVVLHAGARLEMNRWPHFGPLIEMVLNRTDLDVVLMGADADPGLPNSGRLHPLGGLLPFAHFDTILRGSAVFVGNDSGPKHLSAVRGVPTISLHLARLNWSEWGQEGTGAVISRRVPCAGCAIDQHPEDCGIAFACLQHIQPIEVLGEILNLISSAHILPGDVDAS